jgi:hypothetical protein
VSVSGGLYTKCVEPRVLRILLMSLSRCCQIAAQELRVPLEAVFTSESSSSVVPSKYVTNEAGPSVT